MIHGQRHPFIFQSCTDTVHPFVTEYDTLVPLLREDSPCCCNAKRQEQKKCDYVSFHCK